MTTVTDKQASLKAGSVEETLGAAMLSASSAIFAYADRRLYMILGDPNGRVGISALRCLILAEEEPGITPSEVAARLAQETHSVSGLLNRLEDRGLLDRGRDRQDRRVVHCFVTDEGRMVAAQARDVIRHLTIMVEEALKDGVSVDAMRSLTKRARVKDARK